MVRNFRLVVFVRTLLSSSRTLVLLSLNNRHHFRTFPLFTPPSPFTSTVCPWISAGREFLAFKIPITNRTSQVVGFSFFLLISNDCNEGGKTMTLHYAIHTATMTYPWQQRARHLRGRYVWSVFSSCAPLACVELHNVAENFNFCGNALFDSCLFESRPGHRLSWDFARYAPVSLRKFRVVSQIRPLPLPSISFPVPQLIILPFDAIQAAVRTRR